MQPSALVNKHIKKHAKQKGVALISVMLLVAFLVSIIGYMLESQYLMIRQTSLQTENESAYLAHSHAEAWGVKSLLKVATTEKNIEQIYQLDSLDESWAISTLTDKFDGVEISAQLRDLQGLFNLNNLEEGRKGLWYGKFNNLLLSLDIPLSVTDAIVDWIDSDQDKSGIDGAEDLEYFSESPPRRAANQRIRSVEEMLMVKGVTQEIYDKIKPFVIAVDANDVRINVNTAPVEVMNALLRQANAPVSTNGGAESFVANRQGGYDSIAVVLQLPEFAGTGNSLEPFLDTKSDYFELMSAANVVSASSQGYRIGIRRKVINDQVQFDIIYRKRDNDILISTLEQGI